MADITRKSALGVDADSMLRCVQLGQGKIVAGEALSKFDALYLKSDGKFWKAVSTVKVTRTIETGTTDFTEDISSFAGLAYTEYAVGSPVTCLGVGAIVDYETDLTPGSGLFVSDTAGNLADARVATGDTPVAMALSASKIIVTALR